MYNVTCTFYVELVRSEDSINRCEQECHDLHEVHIKPYAQYPLFRSKKPTSLHLHVHLLVHVHGGGALP